eukprot:CAMPEP_0198139656 /NCGR_PEP_ID=MMETSP1443-20131203/2937_1 /TAXON_ID=186043 /ORGANISM="Entomoneis sp., Strain CCMP2396" /LENGTH=48 /DNA_ID= /DNA_START= /DNA_END= /DNA_ORIENTATION=
MSVNEEQIRNASSPIETTESGIFMVVKNRQRENVPSGMDLIPLGISTV